MAAQASDARAGRILWGTVAAGAGIAGGTALMAYTGNWPSLWLPKWTALSVLVGLPTILLISLAFRFMRGAYSAQPVSAFARRAAFAGAFITFAYLVATLILLAAWLTALALGAEVAPPLLQALILTITLFVVTRMSFICILNLAIAVQGPAEEPAALSADG